MDNYSIDLGDRENTAEAIIKNGAEFIVEGDSIKFEQVKAIVLAFQAKLDKLAADKASNDKDYLLASAKLQTVRSNLKRLLDKLD
jgi:hypothetical protein